MSIEISDIYIYIYMWPYVNLYAHAREIIAKKLTTDLLFLSSAAQPRQPSRHSPGQINNGQLDTEYRLRMLIMIASSKRAELATELYG